MRTLIWFELYKIFKKWRTYIGFIAIGLLTPIVQITLYYTGQRFVDSMTNGLQGSFLFTGNLFNGYLVAHLILFALFIHIPFLIVLVGGDILAGEASAGTYRMLLTRPYSRFQIITAKFIAGIFYIASLIFWLALLSLGVSLMIFGSGELVTFKDKLIIFASDDILWRFVLAYGYSILSMLTVFALSFFFSSMVQNAVGPIIATMAVIIVLLILSALPIDFLTSIQPYFFTSHMPQWEGFFNDPVDFTEILNSSLILLAYIVGLYGITTYLFVKKDILS